jgi:hypothetical protein
MPYSFHPDICLAIDSHSGTSATFFILFVKKKVKEIILILNYLLVLVRQVLDRGGGR